MKKIIRKSSSSAMEYMLMHRTKEIARIELDEFSNIASIYEVYDSKHLPVGTVQKEVLTYSHG